MRDLIKKIESYYELIKLNPQNFIYNPFYLLLIPFFIYIYLNKRWNTVPEEIYLLEIKIKTHYLYLLKINSSEYAFKIINNYNEAFSLIKKRINDENINNYEAEVKKRFEYGDYMFVLFYKNIPCSYLFISEKTAKITQVKYNLELPKNCFAIYDVYTFREFRKQGHYKILLSLVFKKMVEKKFEKFLIWILKENLLSIKVHNNLKINNVKYILKEWYRFGFRFFSIEKTNCNLSMYIK